MERNTFDLSLKRKQRFNDTQQGYDVVIVGGGVNGLGTAWDSALRGMKVLLVEKGDIGSGTSSWSSRMIHGGLKYLEKYDIPLVRESLREREWLVKSAPHLVRELRFIIPFYKQNQNSPFILRLGMIAYDILSFDKSLKSFDFFSKKKILEKEPGLNPDQLTGGCAYSDAQVNYSERLCYEIALSARQAGAEILTHVKATDLEVKQGKIKAIKIRDEISGEEVRVPTQVIINNAGPWIDEVWPKDHISLPRMNGGTKGTHLVVNSFPGAPTDAFYYESDDARPMMVIPWKNRYLIGSTDIPFTGNLDTASATQDEYDYILHETNKVLPEAHLTKNDVIYAYTGVRPLPYSEGAKVSDITRRHKIVDHKQNQLDGLYTLVGGKLTTFRQVGEDFGNILSERFHKNTKSRTRKMKLPGGSISSMYELKKEIENTGIPDSLVNRIADQYGKLGIKLAEFIMEKPERQEIIDESFGLTHGEVEWAVTNEEAYRLSDVVARRIMTGLEDDLGLNSLEAVSVICANLLNWDENRRQEEINSYKNYIKRLQVK
ncbi:glycerol-3-phosphate dehydrogenase/oxidase [Apibacter raozihei]|uniref:glycerol-3-phosphate dehydrogenase/oxidase n=1 Tax=Apibacter raozihei TaxID=2500547 RepID=UPI000FE42572|nr:glycerol-3-phosphate dehydrogenase/oxidase [Apibacter raozihei]